MPARRKGAGRRLPVRSAGAAPAIGVDRLLGDIRSLIEAAREQAVRAVNSALVGLYWHIGTRIRRDILGQRRAEYGAEIVSALGTQLAAEFGRGFDRRNLYHMIRFAEVFPDESIVNALRTQSSKKRCTSQSGAHASGSLPRSCTMGRAQTRSPLCRLCHSGLARRRRRDELNQSGTEWPDRG
jgi:hypothetical protein